MIKIFLFSALFLLFLVLIVWVNNNYLLNSGKVSKGKNWESKRYGNTYILKLYNHCELSDTFLDFVKTKKITAGSISGIGAVNSATLRFFDPKTKQYVDKTFNEQMEISNLTGNISKKEGQPYLHLHVTLGNSSYQAYAGHLLNATLNGAGEFFVQTIGHGNVGRIKDDETGLNVYKF